MEGAAVAAEARRWLGTPFQHQGRVLGTGVDCAGLVIGVARALGLSSYDATGYARQPDGHSLAAQCEAQMRRLPAAAPLQAGDVLLLRMGRDPQHLAFVAAVDEAGRPATLIHAYAEIGRCVEHRLDARWRRRILRAYRLPGVR